MPLHDFECCNQQFEELHAQDETVLCPVCHQPARMLVSPLADYTGINSMTVQFATGDKTDSYLTKAPVDPIFLQRQPITQKIN